MSVLDAMQYNGLTVPDHQLTKEKSTPVSILSGTNGALQCTKLECSDYTVLHT